MSMKLTHKVKQTNKTKPIKICKCYLDIVIKFPLIDPNVDSTTAVGTIHEKLPKTFSPNV